MQASSPQVAPCSADHLEDAGDNFTSFFTLRRNGDEQNETRALPYVCGTFHEMPPGKRGIDCDCGNAPDRDWNGAVSIMVQFLSQNVLWSGRVPRPSQKVPCSRGVVHG